MFADWELFGVPLRISVGDRGLKEGRVDLQGRRDTEPSLVAPDEVANHILARLGRKALSR